MTELRSLIVVLGDQLDLDAAAFDGFALGVGPYAGRREEVLNHCRTELRAFAALPNARLKLGGIGMTTYGNGWHKQPQPPSSNDIVARWGDFMRWCIDCFGPPR